MTIKKVSFDELDDVKALNICDFHTKYASNDENLLENAQNARNAVFNAVETQSYIALNKAFRGFGDNFEASVGFEINQGDALGTNILDIGGKEYAASLLFVPISYVVSPEDVSNPAINDMGFKKTLPSKAVKRINAYMEKTFPEFDFHMSPMLLDRDEIAPLSNKKKIADLATVTALYHAERSLQSDSDTHTTNFARYLMENFDIESDFDLHDGANEIKFAICSILQELPSEEESHIVSVSSEWNAPFKLLFPAEKQGYKEIYHITEEFSSAIQECLDEIEEISIIANAMPPQSYCFLDYSIVLVMCYGVLAQAQAVMPKVEGININLQPSNSSSVALTYEFNGGVTEGGEPINFSVAFEYIPFRYLYPMKEIEVMQAFYSQVYGIKTGITVNN
ncbi:hypothetical protein [Vibrio crassostreae]|uniref:hypothetical protein n=1 Tax=Vibrio crassostreae TaxID=246167 RepID=UPI001B301DF7|nr:hypothetical protein [Vibrio crassostreae]